MENAKRPKVMVKVIDGKCILTPLKPQNNDSQPRATNLILHQHLIQQMAPNTTEQSSQSTSNVQHIPAKSKQIAFRKSARTTQSSIATQTISSGEENACSSQILNKLNEIQREQQVTNKKLMEVDKQMKLVRSELDLLADRIAPRVGIVRANSFEFEPIGCKEELDDFEQNLRGQQFTIKMRQFVDARLPTESIEARLHASVDILFKRDFVVKLSWTGMGHPNPKIAFKDYINVLNFYRYIGACHGFNATDMKIKSFLQNKFRHSTQRLNLVGIVKTTYHRHSK